MGPQVLWGALTESIEAPLSCSLAFPSEDGLRASEVVVEKEPRIHVASQSSISQ